MLGIENPQAYIHWANAIYKTGQASNQVNVLLELDPLTSYSARRSIVECAANDSHPAANDLTGTNKQANYDPREDYFHHAKSVDQVMQAFDLALNEMGLEFNYPSIEHTEFTETVSSIYFQTRKYMQCLYSIDIRPLSDLSHSDDIFTMLDEMAVHCGCIPPGLGWSEYMRVLGQRTLVDAFTYDLMYSGSRITDQGIADNLSAQFLSHFTEPARFFSSCSNRPLNCSGGYGTSLLTEFLPAISDSSWLIITILT